MMNNRRHNMKSIATVLTLFLAGCTTSRSIEWSVTEPGCYKNGVEDAFMAPDDGMGLTDIRIGRLPDTGQGPGMMVHFRRHIDGAFGQNRSQPDLLLAVGDWKNSCVVVVQSSACSQAKEIYSSLSSATIPVGFAFDDPGGIQVMHGTQYFLSSRDGQGNLLNWSYYGPDHPLQRTISDALDNLEVCAKPAAEAFQQAGF
jgi:hypothetical protein